MKGRGLTALVIVGVAAWLVWQHFHPGPLPMDDVAERLADEEWGSGFCYDRDPQWPCVIPTRIDLDQANADYEAKGPGESYRRCFYLEVQFETTPFDYSYGGPSEPRTFTPGRIPLRACADLSYLTGDSNDPASWSFVPTDDPPWYEEVLQELHELLCANPPPGAAYVCAP